MSQANFTISFTKCSETESIKCDRVTKRGRFLSWTGDLHDAHSHTNPPHGSLVGLRSNCNCRLDPSRVTTMTPEQRNVKLHDLNRKLDLKLKTLARLTKQIDKIQKARLRLLKPVQRPPEIKVNSNEYHAIHEQDFGDTADDLFN